MTTATKKSTAANGRTDAKDALGHLSEYIAKLFDTSGATRAQWRKKINQIQLDLRQYHGLKGGTAEQVEKGERDYLAFQEPAATVKVTFDMSESELLAQIETLREIVGDSDESEKMRSDADDRLSKFVDQATSRGIAVPAA
jgi:chromosome segregation ATPase